MFCLGRHDWRVVAKPNKQRRVEDIKAYKNHPQLKRSTHSPAKKTRTLLWLKIYRRITILRLAYQSIAKIWIWGFGKYLSVIKRGYNHCPAADPFVLGRKKPRQRIILNIRYNQFIKYTNDKYSVAGTAKWFALNSVSNNKQMYPCLVDEGGGRT